MTAPRTTVALVGACAGLLLVTVGLAAQVGTVPRLARSQSLAPPVIAVPPGIPSSRDVSADESRALITQYCAGCHNDQAKAGGLTLTTFDPARAVEHAATAEKVIRKLRAGMMPPPLARRPEPAVLAGLAATLEMTLDRAAATHPNPGRRSFQRLNRAEYRQAIRDVIGLDVDVEAFLPPDTVSSGFDNLADTQSFSPTLMEGYLRAASTISRLAVGDRLATPAPATYRVPRTEGQAGHVGGTPIGTRGGLAVVHTFPADGDYVLKLTFFDGGTGEIFGGTTITSTDRGEQVVLTLNGDEIARYDVNGWMDEANPGGLTVRTPPIHVSAGPQRLAAAFIQKYAGPNDDLVSPIAMTDANPRIGIVYGITALPHVRDLTITGPQRVTGVSDTSSRRAIFSCRPTTRASERQCATQILTRLATKAFRQPVGADELGILLRLYASERKKTGFEGGVRLAVQAILASPQFLFRVEDAAPLERGTRSVTTPRRIGDYDLASRLSFFLWGAVPDAALMTVAASGRMAQPDVLDAEVRRMLADPRSAALATRFASQWLRLQDVEKVTPIALKYPQYDQSLAEAYVRETELFFENLVREDRSLLEVLTADYSFVNERIARVYGIPNVTGTQFRRVALPAERRGILGHGSVLMQTSVADRTSAVQRGKWIMEVLLGSPPPPPPPNVPAFEETADTGDGRLLTTRERIERHRANPACASCHRVIDPPGLALEHFDVAGQWRIKDNGVPVDAAGRLYDGTEMDGLTGLRDALLKHSDIVLTTFTENLMTYALGRRVEYFDMPTVRAIVRDASSHDARLSSFVLGVVHSAAFQMRGEVPAPMTAAAAVRSGSATGNTTTSTR